MKRADECLACGKRSCYERAVSVDGTTYDEVSCMDHVTFLHEHSDAKAPHVRKRFITSTHKQKRKIGKTEEWT